MIAYCEVCTECSAYVATQNNDLVALQRVADEWNAQLGSSLTAEECVCDGCLGDGRRIGYCRTCEVRACALVRGLENCAYCADYGCEKLEGFFSIVPEARATLDGIHAGLVA